MKRQSLIKLVAVIWGRVELREVTECSEHRKDSEHIGGEEIGGKGTG